jgi:hypothetical protein
MPPVAEDRRWIVVRDAGVAPGAAITGPSPYARPARQVEVEDDRLLAGVFEVNERCLEMLVNAARHEVKASFGLVGELRELLKATDPPVRQRAAARTFLLVDMEFGNADWWRGAGSQLSQQVRLPGWRGSFPRASATQLARSTLLLAWNSLRAARDPQSARLLLGMSAEVSDLIASLRLDQIDRIAQKRFRFVRPRWEDRPAVWRRLLLAAQTQDSKLMGEFNLHALRLLAGELMGSTAPLGRT